MSEIRDPQTHIGAGVTAEGLLTTKAVTLPEDRHANTAHQKVWSLPFKSIDPAGIDDFFFYFKNSGTVDIIFTDFRGASTVAGYADICHVSGTAVFTDNAGTGNPISPVNRYLGNSNTPAATVVVDTDITGLTDDGVIFRIDSGTVNQTNHLKTTAGVIVPPGQALAIRWGAATGILSGTISIAAHE